MQTMHLYYKQNFRKLNNHRKLFYITFISFSNKIPIIIFSYNSRHENTLYMIKLKITCNLVHGLKRRKIIHFLKILSKS